MRFNLRATPEVITLTVLLVLSLLGLLYMGSLIAAPKLLFGRALTALAPSLFPSIILGALAFLCAVSLIQLNWSEGLQRDAGLTHGEWRRGIIFFVILLGYALTMEPLGFLVSSALAIALLSWQMGNRSVVQTAVLSVVGPILLYLAATRLLAVSLPELNFVELAYARLLGE